MTITLVSIYRLYQRQLSISYMLHFETDEIIYMIND